MIAKLIIGLLNIITKIVGIIMYPLDAIVVALIPDVSQAITNITYYLNLPSQFMGWILELFHIPSYATSLIIGYWVFKYAVIGATKGIKTTITLYQRFKM